MMWANRAEEAQQALADLYWNPSIRLYDIEIPCPDGACNTIFHYWWMAHAVDALVDGYDRTRNPRYAATLADLHEGLLVRNGGAFPNELYDDMEWMAIAWLRAYEAIGVEAYKATALLLWEDIQTGWNDHMGGGIAWQKSQPDYKNTPANAPAAILAARLYKAFGRPEDLAWAQRIYGWMKVNLVNPENGFVWDGMNRTGDGSIDKDWKFTYCQGVYIGAGVELFRLTGDSVYLTDAKRTAAAAAAELADPASGLLQDEGDGDGGLFKGILVRYLGELARAESGGTAAAVTDTAAGTDSSAGSGADAITLLALNATALWAQGRDPERCVFGTNWGSAPAERVTLSAQLSGIMLLEQLALLERRVPETPLGEAPEREAV
ncbi:glycoside hydrolase family 76 protein [Paenibacillus sacheonensis]|uniref:Glycosyl hydrolase n=1 Tax=Paenibacillus sacheonensis TaxID=742054 RepID=A0A7X4YT83_9BACL|nr:glycoside hydrolase family 76 protein [Paenibacillus sacheonensis]MBM7568445.1 putative alpha-1,6-mannanase (GH76 family) [Paenibacillus sacheonensis]NBC72143.1 glycosyl hydrolase [Paenibacillus sacheonensis]